MTVINNKQEIANPASLMERLTYPLGKEPKGKSFERGQILCLSHVTKWTNQICLLPVKPASDELKFPNDTTGGHHRYCPSVFNNTLTKTSRE